jgi:hypothetical protein
MDIFSTHVLNKTVEHLHRSASFLLDSCFSTIQTEDSEEIHFDIDKSTPRLAPFVSPLVAGKMVDAEGFETQSFKPAYVKDKRRFDPQAPLKRQLGETIGGALSPMQRREAALSRTLSDQLANLTRREEAMASEALRTGKIIVTGDQYKTVAIDFKRDEKLTQTLVDDKRWGEAKVNVLDNIEDWAGLIQNRSGAAARTVIMDPLAWRLFKNHSQVEKQLDIRRGTDINVDTDPCYAAKVMIKRAMSDRSATSSSGCTTTTTSMITAIVSSFCRIILY